MLEESIAAFYEGGESFENLPDRTERSACTLQWAERGSYANLKKTNVLSLTAAVVITSGLLLGIMQAGVSTVHRSDDVKPLVVDLIALPDTPPVFPVPARLDAPVPPSLLPKREVRPKPIPVVVPALPVPALPVIQDVSAAARNETKSVVSAPVPPAATASALPTIATADLGLRLLSAPSPRYPFDARRRREQGEVRLTVLLDIDGRVKSISVARSSGSERLDEAALIAVRRWRWSPIIEAGVPVMVRGEVTIPFVLES